MTKRSLTRSLGALLAAATLLAGCGGSGGGADPARVRTFNAVADSEPLDLLVSDNLIAAAVAPGTLTGYSDVDQGTRVVKVRSTSPGASVISQASVNFLAGVRQTIVLRGLRSSVAPVSLSDTAAVSAAGKFKLRALNLSFDTTVYDIYVGSDDIAAATPVFAGMSYGGLIDYLELDAGSRVVIFTLAGTKDVVYRSASVEFAEREQATVAIYPARSGRLVNAALLRDSGGSVLANSRARLRLVNGIPGATLDLKAGGAAVQSAVVYSQASDYAETASGARALQVEATNVPGTALASLSATLQPARDHTALAWGVPGQPRLLLLADDNTIPVSASVRLRVVNALGDNVAVNALVNFVSRAPALAAGSAAPYVTLAASVDNTLTFTTTDGTAVVASLGTGALAAGTVATVYLLGTSAAPVARLVTDR
ncbi:MAG: DUF4397 domain-containing protein [Usitatibacter sp.]